MSASDLYSEWRDFYARRIRSWMNLEELRAECGKLVTADGTSPELLLIHAMHVLEECLQRDEALLRQALEALEILRAGLLQMEEHAEDYGKRWAAAHVKKLRNLVPGSVEEKFDRLGILRDRLVAVPMGVRKGYVAIDALRERLG